MIFKKLFIISLLSLLLMNLPVHAQVLSYAEKHQIHSDLLKEDRTYWVGLPNGYEGNPEKHYPVVYILDPEINFEMISGMFSYLTRGRLAIVEKCILIGIETPDRTRDLTPSHAEDAEDISQQRGGSYKNSGGTPLFLNFIEQELKNEIASKYRVTSHSSFIGHSFGGLAVLYAFLKKPVCFDDYIALDPSLWWDEGKLLYEETAASSYSGKRIYIARSVSADEQTTLLTNKLKKMGGAIFKIESFTDENHGSVSLPAMVNAIRFLFYPSGRNR